MEDKIGLFYVYLHMKPCGTVFYVGMSKNKTRHKYSHGRSLAWHKEAMGGFTYEIYKDNLIAKDAVLLESELIHKYGKKCDGGTLVNVSYGGIGILNAGETIGSAEIRKQITIGVKGKVVEAFGGEEKLKRALLEYIEYRYILTVSEKSKKKK